MRKGINSNTGTSSNSIGIITAPTIPFDKNKGAMPFTTSNTIKNIITLASEILS
jgi:hypothetical protein